MLSYFTSYLLLGIAWVIYRTAVRYGSFGKAFDAVLTDRTVKRHLDDVADEGISPTFILATAFIGFVLVWPYAVLCVLTRPRD